MIGIYGGTFDPIHNGHLRTALDIKEALNLQQIRLIPLKQAVHRNQPIATEKQRLAMVSAAVSDVDGFVVDDIEIGRDGPSYMIDTLFELRRQFSEPLCLLLGGDAFSDFLTWKNPEQISALCHIVVMNRPGYTLPEDDQLRSFVAQRVVRSAEMLSEKPAGSIYFHQVTQLDISATDLRQRIAAGRSVKYLLPDTVNLYIEQNSIYSD